MGRQVPPPVTGLSTSEAASRAGMSPAVFRATMSRARRAGQDCRLPGPDARTPMWDWDAVTAYLAGRPHGLRSMTANMTA